VLSHFDRLLYPPCHSEGLPIADQPVGCSMAIPGPIRNIELEKETLTFLVGDEGPFGLSSGKGIIPKK